MSGQPDVVGARAEAVVAVVRAHSGLAARNDEQLGRESLCQAGTALCSSGDDGIFRGEL